MKKYTVIINGIDYSQYLQLPFSIKENSDDRYDTGSFTLRKTNRKEPFPIESKIKIEIYDNNDLIDTYHMEVINDNVRDMFVGPVKYYNHTIDIIELTKKLDRLYLPDFTITNPATKYILKPYEQTTTTWKSTKKNLTYTQKWDTGFNGRNTGFVFDRLKLNLSIACSAPAFDKDLPSASAVTFLNNSEIELPIPKSTSKVKYTATGSITTGWDSGTFSGSDTTDFNDEATTDEVEIIYYYKLKTQKDYTKIAYGVADSIRGTLNTSFFTIADSTRFIIKNNKPYFKIGISGDENVDIKAEVLVSKIQPTSVADKMHNHFISYEDSDMPAEFRDIVYYGYWEYYYNREEGKPLRYQYIEDILSNREGITSYDFFDLFTNSKHNISATNTGGSADIGLRAYSESDLIAEVFTNSFRSLSDLEGTVKESVGTDGYKTIQDVLEKINILLDDSDKFTFNNIVKDILNTQVPERVYSKKNVAEILFELGSLVSAYPYLDVDNNLTLERLNPTDNSRYTDFNTEENVDYNEDMGVNSYITDVKNMISSPDKLRTSYSYWPSKNSFAYPNGNWKNKMITPDTNMIEISDSTGIYYLKYIKVTNCFNTKKDSNGKIIVDANTVLDLTDFCPEYSYYNTLYTQSVSPISNMNKSNCIYWTKGSNIINLDAIEAAEKAAIWGRIEGDTYKIIRAILYSAQINISPEIIESDILTDDPTKFKFQICYIDNIHGLIHTKKFNQKQNDTNEILSNYNQTDNNISAQEWLNAAQVNILRRGNNSLSKNVYIKNFNELPKLGEIKRTDTDIYLADSINYTFDNNICGVNLTYNKNYNKIDPSVVLSKEYRQYEIYGAESVTRNININRYLYLDTTRDMTNTYSNHRFKFNAGYNGSVVNNIPSYMLLIFKDEDGNRLQYSKLKQSGSKEEVDKEIVPPIIIPINYSASGNSVIFQAALLDNYAAGYRQNINDNLKYIDIFGGTKEGGAKTLSDIRYVDDLGEAESVSVFLVGDDVYNSELYPAASAAITETDLKNLSSCLDYEEDIPIKKDNREKLNFIYQIHFMSHENNIKWNPAICKYLFKDSTDIIDVFKEGNPKYYGLKYNMSSEQLLPLVANESRELVPDPSKIDMLNITTNANSAGITGSGNTTAVSNLTGFVYAYPSDYEIIFHIDKKTSAGSTINIPYIYFNFYKNRV